MPATTFVRGDGTRTRRPGVYPGINGDALAGAAPGIKRLLLIGEAVGGAPISTTAGKALRATSDGRARSLFRSGPLLDAARFAFDASADDVITGAPPEVVFAKVNPAARGAITLTNDDGDAIALTTRHYGVDANLSCVQSLGGGTTKGLKAVFCENEATETLDNIGGDAAMNVRYDGDADDVWLSIDPAASVSAIFSREVTTGAGDDVEKAGTFEANDHAVVASSDAADTYQKVTVYGLDGDNDPISETVTLTGTTAVTTTATFAAITGVRVNKATKGSITVKDEQDPVGTAFTIAATLLAANPGGTVKVVGGAGATGNVTVVGENASGEQIAETIALDGDTAVAGSKSFSKVFYATIDTKPGAAVDVTNSADTTLLTIASGAWSAGLNIAAGILVLTRLPIEGKLTLNPGGDGAFYVVVRGVSSAGVATNEAVNLADGDAKLTTTTWRSIDHIEFGLSDDDDVTISGTAASLPKASYGTLDKIVARLAGLPGFYAEAAAPNPATFALGDFDKRTSVAVDGASFVAFRADLKALVDAINGNSSIFTAARASGATGIPDYVNAPAFATGGTEGATALSDWVAALKFAEGVQDCFIVALSTDAAVHNEVRKHVRAMAVARGGKARSAVLPIALSKTLSEVEAHINTYGDRNIAFVAQGPDLFDTAGTKTEYDPEDLAVIAAAMLAGSEIAEPLTAKRPNVLGVRSHSSWDPEEDAEAAIAAGLLFVRPGDAGGFVFERDVTSHRADDNPAFSAIGANESANESVNRMARNVGTKIGRKALPTTRATLTSLAIAELERQVEDGTIKSFIPGSVSVEDAGDHFPIAYFAAPIEGIQAIPLTAHVTRIPG